jgi:hypothetical protein
MSMLCVHKWIQHCDHLMLPTCSRQQLTSGCALGSVLVAAAAALTLSVVLSPLFLSTCMAAVTQTRHSDHLPQQQQHAIICRRAASRAPL